MSEPRDLEFPHGADAYCLQRCCQCVSVSPGRGDAEFLNAEIAGIPAFMTFLIGAFFVIVVAFVVATTHRVKYP